MIRFRHGWRRFKPAAKPFRGASDIELFAQVEKELDDILHEINPGRWRRFDVTQLSPIIDERRHMAELSGSSLDWVTVLVLQAPRAVLAQRHMDKHPNGYDGGHARLYELIDFNDSFVSSVLSLPEDHLSHFQAEARLLMDRFCSRLHAASFSNEQYEAITHGLSREIAVYRGVIREGLRAEMTTRAQDAKGVDIIIADPETGRSVNVDVKTRSAYYYRLKDLRQEDRISAETAEQAEVDGFCEVRNGHSAEGVDVVLLRIDPEEVGDIENFSFTNTQRLGEMLRHILRVHGATMESGKVNEYAG